MWHIRFSENDIRKGTFEQLQALAAKGKLRASMPVRAPDSTQWVRADSVPDLFPIVAEAVDVLDAGAIHPAETRVALKPSPQPTIAADNSKLLIWVAGGVGGLLVLGLLAVIIASMLRGSDTVATTNATSSTSVPTVVPTAPPAMPPTGSTLAPPVAPPVASPTTPSAQPPAPSPTTVPPAANSLVKPPGVAPPSNPPPSTEGEDITAGNKLSELPAPPAPIDVYQADGTVDADAFLALMRMPMPRIKWASKPLSTHAAGGAVQALAFSGDKKRLAAAYADGNVIVWDTDNGSRISEIDGALRGSYRSVALSSTGKHMLLGGDAARGGLVVDADTGKSLFVHNAPKHAIVIVSISADDKLASMCDEGGYTHQYPLLGGRGNSGALLDDKENTAVALSAKCRYAVTKNNRLLVAGMPSLFNLVPAEVTFPMRASSVDRAFLSAGERYLLVCDINHNVEIRALDVPTVPWHAKIRDLPKALALSSDGRTLALGQPTGAIELRHVIGSAEPPKREVTRHLRKLFHTGKFAELEAIASRIEFDTEPFSWSPNNSPYAAFCRAMTERGEIPAYDEGTDAQTAKWLAERPDSALAKILRARLHVSAAWRYRGGGFADKVKPEQWQLFHEEIDKAHQIIVPLCERADAPPTAYFHLFTVAKAESWPTEKWKPYWDRAYAKAPQHLDVHEEIMSNLMPRWGGQPGDCKQYATKVADEIGGKEGDVMYARLAIGQWLSYFKDEEALSEAGFEYERVNKGILALTESKSEGAWAKHIGLRLAFARKDQAQAHLYAEKMQGDATHWEIDWWPHEYFVAEAFKFAR